jgi:hypothetical protein
MTDLNTLALGLLDTEQFFLGPKTYERITLEAMRQNVLDRAQETLEALESYTGGVLAAPMARTARNAISIKIGYGEKNEALWSFKDAIGNDTDTLRANGRTREEQISKAVIFFNQAISTIASGRLDEKINEKLKSYQERSEAGKKARAANAAKREALKKTQLALAA